MATNPEQELILEERGGARFSGHWLVAVAGGLQETDHRGTLSFFPRTMPQMKSWREGVHGKAQERAENWALEHGHMYEIEIGERRNRTSGQEDEGWPVAQNASELCGGRGEFPEKGQPCLMLQGH